MNYQEENERLRAENQELGEGLTQVKELLRLALARIEELERQIRTWLRILYRCQVSTGEIVGLLHRVVSHARAVLESIKG